MTSGVPSLRNTFAWRSDIDLKDSQSIYTDTWLMTSHT